MDTVITVKEEAIDWLTCTAKTKNLREALSCLAERVVAQQMEDGFDRGPWHAHGYVGETIEGCSFGNRYDSNVLRLSGFAAAYWGWEAIGCADNVSRLDIQVTVCCDPPREYVARDGYQQLKDAGPGGRKGASCSFLINSGGGSTAYLGRRSSDRFLRLYDKWRESNIEYYTGCWRYELEVKNEPALDLARGLLTSLNRQRAIRDTVHRYCTEHGLTPLFGGGTEGLPSPAPRPPTDFDRTCKWLSQQVRSSAQEVVYRCGVEGLLKLLEIDPEIGGKWRRGPLRPHGNHLVDDKDLE